MTHQRKDCVDRPRKIGAKFTGKELCGDEHIVPDLGLGFDGKRDRWAGYDAAEYKDVMREFEVADMERKRRKAREMEERMGEAKLNRRKKRKQKEAAAAGKQKKDKQSGSDSDSEGGGGDSDTDSEGGSDVDDEGEDARLRDFDATSAPMGSKDDRTRTTTRNLRIREDTAKYLFNLDVNSAHYDPKTRSMRDNPMQHLKADDQPMFQGDNKPRTSGEANEVKQMELFAWEAYTHGANVHFNALPTQLEKMHQQHVRKKERLVEETKQELLDRYGGREHLDAPKELLFSQTENYVEYARDGTALRGADGQRKMAKSKYEEDVFVLDHTSVWGSWYDANIGRWGYWCCKSTDRHTHCSPPTHEPHGFLGLSPVTHVPFTPVTPVPVTPVPVAALPVAVPVTPVPVAAVPVVVGTEVVGTERQEV
eukprot:GHVS01029366.1.p1 GENE.GHVS01029366.1~~GHVS01029366.1.p1  ORF type:complete len:473 (+),score=119.52 GHVS01029366.1:151-1419(+)